MGLDAEAQVKRWLSDVVIGLNLCPFARKPFNAGGVRFRVSEVQSDEALLVDLQDAFH